MPKYLLLFSFFYTSFVAQEKLTGTVLTESNYPIDAVMVVNIQSGESTYTDAEGKFAIAGKVGEEIRFIKNKYDRVSYVINIQTFISSIKIVLKKSEIPLPEVEVVYHVTGNLKKDVRALTKIARYDKLKNDLSTYMKTPLKENQPRLTQPASFESPTINAVQVDVRNLIVKIAKLFPKKGTDVSKDPVVQKRFFNELKSELREDFFVERGIKPSQIDDFLKYVNEKKNLISRNSTHYNIQSIRLDLESAVDDYLNTIK